MTTRTYPTDIVDGEGRWGRIHRGHGHDVDMLRADLAEARGYESTATGVKVVETWLRWVPRIKWCGRLDGWGCDDQGEWHSHWFEVKPDGDLTAAFTVVHWEWK